MSTETSTLVMAGSREAHGIVAGLLDRGERVIASLPETERTFEPMSVPTRMGPFPSRASFVEWGRARGVSKVIDANHAFDTDLSEMVQNVCRDGGLPYLRVLRPAWHPIDADDWIDVASVREAAEAAPSHCRLFSNTGWLSQPDYAGFRGAHVFLRQAHPVTQTAGYSFITLLPGEPPFTVAEEVALFQKLRITHLICRNVGGEASATKLLAARELQLPVYMVARRPLPVGCPRVRTVEEALAWSETA